MKRILILTLVLCFSLASLAHAISAGGMIAGDFLQKVLLRTIALELIRAMPSIEGRRTIDDACNSAREEINSTHRERQENLIRKYERKLEGKDVAHPDKRTQSIINRYNQEMEYIDNFRIKNLKELENQRTMMIDLFKRHWIKNDKKTTQKTM